MFRFWDKVDKSGDCWEWRAGKEGDYGRFWDGSRMVLAHRFAFELAHGYLPEVVRHRCDNPGCVRPSHLMGGTQADNIRDCIDRGRFTAVVPRSGERSASSKLTGPQVVEIRERLSSGETHRSIAADYGVCRATVSQINRGANWK